MLEGDRLIGRIEMKSRRAENNLDVTGLWLEPKVNFSKGRQAKLNAELNPHARFIDVSSVLWVPGYLKI